ncbi:ABC transporter substrate-binding protein [uncultured Friedmanniella sp.]|uniref:ABC transporter substrate-binding protein n=1 Tax=uncultured Friedmanniella sp. TaxID=335381 RepID=UPI0035CBD0EF
MIIASRTLAGAASLVLVAGLAACGSSAEPAASPAPSAAAGAVDLSDVCPATVVIQTDWNPESEHGAQYALLGSDYTVNKKLKTVSGPLMSSGKTTGVNVEIRAGGPAIGFESVATQMYKDKKITIGYASTDGQIQTSKELPVKAVMAPLDINPQMIMWDPATYPQVKTIKDLGATGAVVRVFGGASYMEYLIDSGQIDRKNVDEGYDGTPANFVAAQGKDAQQGFASAEPYIYENEIKDWDKPVAFQLVHDAGWQIYAGEMSVKTADFEKLTPCLKKLVPVMQQAEVDFYTDPTATNKLILDLVDSYDTGWVYSQGVADFSVEQQKKLKLVGNGDNATIGDFDLKRVQKILDVMGPIADKLGTPPAAGLTVDDLATNEFIDTSIGLPQ